VGTPARRHLFKALVQGHAPVSQEGYEAQVAELWAIPQREGRYMALDWACRCTPFITLHALPLYEGLVREGAWWDTVDVVAAHLVGRLLLEERAFMKPVLDRWVSDECLWIRRTAVLAHLKHKAATDEAQLFAHCLRLAPEREFFIRKAIGWALREYGKTAPACTKAFLAAHRDELSGLSYREGMKHLA
jgi:3-methyladenine DNA glycosylase AlkD